MFPLKPISTDEQPRVILAAAFKSLGGELPIRSGWGYTREDACIIDKQDPVVSRVLPFDGIGIERVFLEKRIYIEMLIFRPPGEAFSGITWNPIEQQLIEDGDKIFDKLTVEITAFSEGEWEELKAEWEGPNGYRSPTFDMAAHNHKREQRMIRLKREFWFDITSSYG
ncbi:MAG: hypothetical protein NFCOHLIN_03263 [Gammaproteobacteria bacterium]|nr:hypothetical protein [Gammaproteobacteria bacterium]